MFDAKAKRTRSPEWNVSAGAAATAPFEPRLWEIRYFRPGLTGSPGVELVYICFAVRVAASGCPALSRAAGDIDADGDDPLSLPRPAASGGSALERGADAADTAP